MKKNLLILLSLLLLPSCLSAKTEVYIGVTGRRASFKKIPVALAQFLPLRRESRNDLEIAFKMREIVRSDLLFSRYFDIKESPLSVANVIISKESFEFWRKIGAKYLICAEAADYGKVWTLKGKIYDLKSGNKLLERHFQSQKRGLRMGAHAFSDRIIESLANARSIASTKIAFANDSTGKKEIYMVDYDGENLVRFTNNKTINLLPKWSHDGTKIYYTSYKYSNPDMFEIDLKRGTIKPYIAFQGLNIPGRDSPDGDKMVMTLSLGKDPSIYLLNRKRMRLKKLLKTFGVSSSPTYSPDGKQIAFVSDISGNPQIYIYEFSSKKAKRITRFNWCDSPAWSPRGEWIAFAGRKTRREKMNIFITDPTGSIKYRLTQNAGDNENPTWSADGRFIAFTTTRRSKREIFIMDSDGSAQHPLVEIDGNSYTPDWSPR